MELEVTKKQVESLLSTSELCEEIHQKLKEIENLSNKNHVQTNDIHILNKRNVDQQTTGHNYTNSSRQARSVGRGKHSHCKNRNGCRCRCYETSGKFLTNQLHAVWFRLEACRNIWIGLQEHVIDLQFSIIKFLSFTNK